MDKSELKNGMYVKLRNGDLELKVGDKLIDTDGGYNICEYYANDLTHTMSKEWDIMEVYVSSSSDLFKEDTFERIWVRKETREPKIGDVYVDSDGDKMVIYDIGKYSNGDAKYNILIAVHIDSKIIPMDVNYNLDEIKELKFVTNNIWYVDSLNLIMGCLNDEQIQN